MLRSFTRIGVMLLAALCAVTAHAAPAAVAEAAASRPIAWLWDGARAPAWSRAEVAVVVGHYWLQGDRLRMRPRMHAPVLEPGTRVTPVVHVELSSVQPPTDPARHRQALIDAVLEAAGTSTSGRVQLDLEARPSQRMFYLALVRDLRAALPPHTLLSVTALAWWCRSDAWMGTLAADEVVPMYFRMGRDGAALRRLVEDAPERLHPRCAAGAAGFSAQEPFDARVGRRYARTYWFDDRRWRGAAPALAL